MKPRIFQFKEIGDDRGSLISLESGNNIPFDIKRVYYIFGNKNNIRRGFHAHKTLEQILICVHGSCKILLDDGREKTEVELSKKNEGLYIGNIMWREMYNFSHDAVLMVLASEVYDEKDYIRDYNQFVKYLKSN